MPYWKLTSTLSPTKDSLRDLDAEDLALLTSLSVAERTFVLKIGAPPDEGNFGSLDIPDPAYPNQNGGNLYKDNIFRCNMSPIGPGDTLNTLPANRPEPTRRGVEDFCSDPKNGTFDSVTGNCYDLNSELGITAKTALWSQATPKDGGSFKIIVRQIVSFKIDNVSKTEVTGHFLPILRSGGITPLKTTINRPILVK